MLHTPSILNRVLVVSFLVLLIHYTLFNKGYASTSVITYYESDLLIAAKKNNTKKVKKILQEQPNINVNVQNAEGFSSLMLATINGNIKIIRELYKKRANPNLQDGNGYTALYHAVINQQTKAINELSKFYNINSHIVDYKCGMTPLMYATWSGNSKAIKELSKFHDFNVNFQVKGGFTALMVAALGGNIAGMKALNAISNLDPHIKTTDGKTALHYLYESKLAKKYLLEIFISHQPSLKYYTVE